MPFHITSSQNEQFKALLRLEKRAERDRRQLTLVEGVREVERALAAGHLPVEAWVCPELACTPAAQTSLQRLEELDTQRRCKLYLIPSSLFSRLAVREESGGILLLIPYLTTPLEHVQLGANPLVLVIEGVEKPGNLGAILRTADAAGVDAVIVSSGTTDVHNPNVVRASLGTLFAMQISETETSKAIQWLRANNFKVVAASPDANKDYTQLDATGPIALILGSEAYGLNPIWANTPALLVHIPMAGIADSLNLSTSAAILLYEVVRQRRTPRT